MAAGPARAGTPVPVTASAKPGPGRFAPGEFATVGVFGVDWLLDPRFTRMLDHIAASPGAVRGVRVFGSLSLGRDKTFPTTSANVWDDPDGPMDFSRTLAALDTLASRGLVPFLPLTFFPRAVSPVPTQPPPGWARWQALVRGFLDACVGRFGAGEVSRWWFEAWNEPNMPPFWAGSFEQYTGSFEQYIGLYRATSDAVRASGHKLRLGGPVVAYMPGEGAALVERFLRVLAAEPQLKCDFISLHRKGAWTNEEGDPDLARVTQAAEATAEAILRIVPERASGLAIVNDEADMLVGFDRPYPPRMTAQFPAWLASVAIAYDALSARYAAHGLRFHAASDDANQQLAQGPFDGRRTLMTPVSGPDGLLKLPVYAFYELLRLMGPLRCGPAQGALPPGVSHLLTRGEHGISALLTSYAGHHPAVLDYEIQDIPWLRVNVAVFCIDSTHTDPQAASPNIAAMRQAQELGTLRALRSGVRLRNRALRQQIPLERFSTVLVWITPFRHSAPAAPSRVAAAREGGNVVLRWTPDSSPDFYSYEVIRAGKRISPAPLRAALWIDTAPPPGALRYLVAAVSASGERSAGVVAEVAPADPHG